MTFRSEYAKRRIAERRAEGLALLGGKCAICGSCECLEFDHKDRSTKVTTVSRLAMAAREKWLAEVMKCQLLCRLCHERKSIEELGLKVAKGTHGTVSSYRYCHCQACRDAHRAAWLRSAARRAERAASKA